MWQMIVHQTLSLALHCLGDFRDDEHEHFAAIARERLARPQVAPPFFVLAMNVCGEIVEVHAARPCFFRFAKTSFQSCPSGGVMMVTSMPCSFRRVASVRAASAPGDFGGCPSLRNFGASPSA